MAGQESGRREGSGVMAPVITVNAAGRSPFVLACEHASNRIPDGYGTLGLSAHQRLMHIAWDPGAFPVALLLSGLLDAPLVASTVSRLVIDCNRHPDAPDLIPTISERTEIPGNAAISPAEREARIRVWHAPYHAALEALLDARAARGEEALLVDVHSFTPVYRDVRRPWPIGLIHGRDERCTRALFAALEAEDGVHDVGWNQPYSAHDGVTYTLEHHGNRRGLDCTMIELRHDEILEAAGIELWGRRLARTLVAAREACRAPAPLAADAGQGAAHA